MMVPRRAVKPTVSSISRKGGLDLRGAGVGRQTQFGRVPQSLLDGERIVQNVFLRHDGDVLLEGLEVGVQILAVEQHCPRDRRQLGR